MTIKQTRMLLDSRKISVKELTEENLKKIEENKSLNSFITVCDNYAAECAKDAQNLIDTGNQKPLTGIPFSIKDNICTKGVLTTCASKMLCDFVPQYSATAISYLEKQKYILLGKNNMDEFGMGSTCETSYFGAVLNPVNNSVSAGGSSGGSAASVRAGLCAAALGSDTGGSVRLPAAYCGVFGLLPTYGRISRYGLIAFASSLEQIGILANCTDDIKTILNCLSGKDKNDQTTKPVEVLKKSGKRIGIPRQFFEKADSKINNKIFEIIKIYEKQGFEIKECDLSDLDYALPAYYLISSAEAASNLSRFDGVKYGFSTRGQSYDELLKNSRSKGFGDEVKRRIMLGNYALHSGAYDEYYLKAVKIRNALKLHFSKLFEEVDFLITPTSVSLPPKLGMNKAPAQVYQDDILTVTQNLAGLPCLNVPCDRDLGIGMSITGRAFDEYGILSLAGLLEKECAL